MDDASDIKNPEHALLTPSAALALIAPVVKRAGELGMDYARNGARRYAKADNSPVTEADLALDALIAAELKGLGPGWLSEETTDTADRLAHRQVFIVDPIDGTRGFIAGNGQWAVSVALVQDGRPIAGALYRPADGEFYTAAEGLGAFLNDRPIRVMDGDVGATSSVGGTVALVASLAHWMPTVVRQPTLASLALRIALVADGRWDAVLVKPGSHDWDIAAADIILREAGGRLTTPGGEDIVYNRADPVHGLMVGAGRQRQAGLARLLRNAVADGS